MEGLSVIIGLGIPNLLLPLLSCTSNSTRVPLLVVGRLARDLNHALGSISARRSSLSLSLSRLPIWTCKKMYPLHCLLENFNHYALELIEEPRLKEERDIKVNTHFRIREGNSEFFKAAESKQWDKKEIAYENSLK